MPSPLQATSSCCAARSRLAARSARSRGRPVLFLFGVSSSASHARPPSVWLAQHLVAQCSASHHGGPARCKHVVLPRLTVGGRVLRRARARVRLRGGDARRALRRSARALFLLVCWFRGLLVCWFVGLLLFRWFGGSLGRSVARSLGCSVARLLGCSVAGVCCSVVALLRCCVAVLFCCRRPPGVCVAPLAGAGDEGTPSIARPPGARPGQIPAGVVVVIRYEGPIGGPGMREVSNAARGTGARRRFHSAGCATEERARACRKMREDQTIRTPEDQNTRRSEDQKIGRSEDAEGPLAQHHPERARGGEGA